MHFVSLVKKINSSWLQLTLLASHALSGKAGHSARPALQPDQSTCHCAFRWLTYFAAADRMVTDSVLELALSCTDPVHSLVELALLVPSWHPPGVLRTLLVGPYLLDLCHYHSSPVVVGHAYRLDLHASLAHLFEDIRLSHSGDIHHVHLFHSPDLNGSSSWCCWTLDVATSLLG